MAANVAAGGRGPVIRRRVLLAAGAAGAMGTRIARAQSKPEKLIFVGDNGPWHWTLVEEVAPAFEKETGIKIDFTLLPIDALSARLKAELNSGSNSIDVIQWTAVMAGWLSPYMEDHEKLLQSSAATHGDFDWDDFLPPVRAMSTYEGKLCGIPYRTTMGILHYQKALLEEAGITRAPETFAELQTAAIATTKAGGGTRYGLGYLARQGPALVGGWSPFMRSNGGAYYDPKTYEILINQPPAVEALEFYGDLMTKHHAVVPDSITWEFDEIVAGGQTDRYAMAVTLAPYGTLINDPKLSKTAGRWSWAVTPGGKSRDQSRTTLGGWTFGVPKGGRNQDWAWAFIQLATSKQWMRRSLERGNAPPRVSVLNDPSIVERFGWAPVVAEAMKTAEQDPREPIWPALELQLRSGVSAVVTGQKQAKQALDDVAADWRRTMRRAGIKPV